jgi:transposase-like protein
VDPLTAPDRPVAGRDYPADRAQFLEFFPDEMACQRYLEQLSWPHGFQCPECGDAREPWRGSRHRLVCRSCGHQTTVTAGTLFQGTRTPLRQWFAAAWLVTTAEQGVSARQLARELRLGSYETAWTMLHRFRRAMVRSGRPRLVGRVELGTVPVPGRRDPAAGTGPGTAAIALEDRGEAAGRVRMHRLASGSPADLTAFVGGAVEPGTLIRAVRLAEWHPLATLGHPTERAPRLLHLPAVERALAAWLRGTHQGATSPAQLDWYLDEFTFRFNRRGATHRGLLFYRLLEEAVVTPPVPYRQVVSAAPAQPPDARAADAPPDPHADLPQADPQATLPPGGRRDHGPPPPRPNPTPDALPGG